MEPGTLARRARRAAWCALCALELVGPSAARRLKARPSGRAGPPECIGRGPAPRRPLDADPADFARRVNGTWVRRLSIAGVPVQTDSYMYFDLDATGSGTALAIDRVNLGPDTLTRRDGTLRLEGLSTTPGRDVGKRAPTAGATDGGPIPPGVTGALWTVNAVRSRRLVHSSGPTTRALALTLSGEYHTTDPQYPSRGFRFQERAVLVSEGTAYVNVGKWLTPAAADGASFDWDHFALDGDPVDERGRFVAQSGRLAPRARWRRPTMRFVNCAGNVIDIWVKVNSARPAVAGLGLREAFERMKADGTFARTPR